MKLIKDGTGSHGVLFCRRGCCGNLGCPHTRFWNSPLCSHNLQLSCRPGAATAPPNPLEARRPLFEPLWWRSEDRLSPTQLSSLALCLVRLGQSQAGKCALPVRASLPLLLERSLRSFAFSEATMRSRQIGCEALIGTPFARNERFTWMVQLKIRVGSRV